MPKTKGLAQIARTRPLRFNGELAAGLKLGFLLRGTTDRAASEIQDHLRMRELVQSGEYKEIVAEARKSSNQFDDLEPFVAFLKLCGTSTTTWHRREKALQELGLESCNQLRGIGLAWKDIRILSDAPEGVKKEMKALTDGRAITKEAIEALISKAAELAGEKQDALRRADRADKEREKTEEKLKRSSERLLAKDEDLRDARAELRIAKEGAAKTPPMTEVEAACTEAQKSIDRAVTLLNRVGKFVDADEVLAAQVGKTVLTALGPLSQLKMRCLKAVHFAED